MRVLDLDLDFFVSPIATWQSDFGPRLPDDAYDVWEINDVKAFLESQCQLSQNKKVKGKIVCHHHEAFFYLRELIIIGKLRVPFELVHIDAHADLGLGDAGWKYLTTEVLHKDLRDRMYPKVGNEYLGPGNYLAFAVACRWISELVFVRHSNAVDDLMAMHFKDFNVNSGFLQLKKYDPHELEQPLLSMDLTQLQPLDLEPCVPMKSIPVSEYFNSQPFDFAVISWSPGFTPPKADRILEYIRSYLIV